MTGSEPLDALVALAEKRGARLWLVGGAVRDRRLGRPTPDFDLVCSVRPEPLAKEAAARLRARLVVLDDVFHIYRLVLPDRTQLDLAQLQGASIEDDLARRDFTINAIAEPLGGAGPGPLDPFGGGADLKRKLLRAVSDRAFREDPLRVLRAYRLAAELGFRIEASTSASLGRHAAGLKRVAAERVQAELWRLLAVAGAGRWLAAMDAARVLTRVFPELESSRACAHVYYGPEGVLGHSLKTVARLDFLLERLARLYPKLEGGLSAYLQLRPPALLRLAALLHDVAKPRTARKREGRLRFFGHEEQGAAIADRILERLRFSAAHRAQASAMIRHHLRPGNLAANPTVSDKAAYRYYQELGDDGLALALMCWADYASYLADADLRRILPRIGDHPNRARYDRLPEGLHKTLRHIQVVGWLMSTKLQRPERVEPPKLVDGHDVMKLLDLGPGPEVGRILEKLREAQAVGKVRTRREALEFARKAASSADKVKKT